VPGVERPPSERHLAVDRPPVAGALELLGAGDVEVLGLLPYSSNYTFLARVSRDLSSALAVYKPRRGERPLWDFPAGSLAAREVASWLVSEAAGWRFVPPTVLRRNLPLGEGSLQLFVEHDPERHYFVLMEERLDDFASFAAFDVVINNADRKAGHILEDESGLLWGVDHGVTFHVESKLRTVIWQFAGEKLSAEVRDALRVLQGALGPGGEIASQLGPLLSPPEIHAAHERVDTLLEVGRFPAPRGERALPWPLV
jgi:uncharacterized repeat protein (TIGR03843 family)